MFVVPATRRAKKLAIHFGPNAMAEVGSMLARQNRHALPVSQRQITGGAIGCVGGGALPATGDVCCFTGLPIRGPANEDLTDADAAARLFPTYDGAFGAVYWDAGRETLVVATDCLGMHPLYIRHNGDELTLVSETKAIQGAPDLAAWGAFILSGRPIADRSLVAGLRRVPPASVLTFDLPRRRLDIRRYWNWPEPSDSWRTFDFLNSLEQDMRAYAAFGESGTLLLSGGFDSRLLLFLLKRAGISADAQTVSHADEHGDSDGRLAEAVAKLAGISHYQTSPRHDFFSSMEYLDYLWASDAGSPSMDLFISKVASQINSAAVWDGIIGPIFRAHYQQDGGFDAYLKQRINGPDGSMARAARFLFKPAVVEAMFAGFSQDLRAEVAQLPQNVYGMIRFMFENRIRNRPAMNTLKVYANRADVYTPGLSKEFLAHALIIPPGEKRHAKFYRSLFSRLDNRALTVPVLSGGELIRTGRVSPAYCCEWLRIETNHLRGRYPSLFPGTRQPTTVRSSFLGQWLLSDDDNWLNPGIGNELKTASRDNYVAWKLLFHWKAWRWVHEGRLHDMLGDVAR